MLYCRKKIMCAINGFNYKDLNLIKKMSALTSSRGPDNEGFYSSENYTVAHNRLSIIDPEIRSNQPFHFKNYILSFNGEIYNYIDLKNSLIKSGYNFETKSDTEVLIKLFDFEGINCFKKLSGIFAISIYDTNTKKLYLIRDAVGVKPLYYYYESSSKKFIYSSLIKSLLISLNKKKLNNKALICYSNFNRNDYRETFFKDIYKVLPGELIEVSNGKYKREKLIKFEFKNIDKNHHSLNEINYYFSKQFISDVPVALSLSGGIDSNIIFHELLKNKGTQFTNYSVFFKDSAKYSQDYEVAKNISKTYGVKLNSVEVSAKDFIENAEKIVDIVEEPTGNTNSISNYILSQNISEKVLFSGDGGDEVFTGYNKYMSIYIVTLINKINFLNKLDIKFKNKNLNRIFMNRSEDLFLSFSEQNLIKNQKKIYNNFKYIDKDDLKEIFNQSKDFNKNPNLSNIMYHDLDTWVPNDILLRNDKIYANQGIEVRVPFLDKNIIEKFLMMSNYKKFGFFFNSKNFLKKTYKKELNMTLKKKYGFNSPFAGWLRKDIYEFANQVLSKNYYDSSSYINLTECKKLITRHKEEYCDPYLIWNLISLQIFLRKYKI